MRRDALGFLTEHRPELARRFGVSRLGLFGSQARREARPDSDVDLYVEFSGGHLTFDNAFALREFLSTGLGVPIDLVTPQGLTPRLKRLIAKDLVWI